MREPVPASPVSNFWEQYAPLAASMVLHLTLLGVLAAIVLPGDRPQVSAIETAVVRETQAERVVLADPLREVGEERSSGGAEITRERFLPRPSEDEVQSAPRSDLALPLDLSQAGQAVGSLAEQVTPLRSSAGSAGEGGDSAGDGGGEGERFFSLNGSAKKTVFVVDNSRSMNFPHPGPPKTRLGRVKFELLYTIAELTEEQRFFIIFFNTDAVPMPASHLVHATPGAKRQYLEWMSRIKAEGTTEPDAALLMALALNPDEIYFLTDGMIRYKVVPNITQANRAGVRIHTICFGDERGEEFLKEMADLNGGTYKFFPDGEMPTERPVRNAERKASSTNAKPDE